MNTWEHKNYSHKKKSLFKIQACIFLLRALCWVLQGTQLCQGLRRRPPSPERGGSPRAATDQQDAASDWNLYLSNAASREWASWRINREFRRNFSVKVARAGGPAATSVVLPSLAEMRLPTAGARSACAGPPSKPRGTAQLVLALALSGHVTSLPRASAMPQDPEGLSWRSGVLQETSELQGVLQLLPSFTPSPRPRPPHDGD